VKVVVLGANGQVGHELVGALSSFNEVVALGRQGGDLADVDALRETVRSLRPDAVVNAASYNDVDGAEREPDAALRTNRDAVAMLGEEALRGRFALVHYSTDFVFDGRATRPYVETDAPAPLGAYGRSKLEGERALEALEAPAIVFRTAWVYSLRRKSFVSTMLKLGRTRPVLRVVADQSGSPTFCRDLAQATALVLHRAVARPFESFLEDRGVYHLAGEGSATRAELARATLELARHPEGQAVASIEPVSSAEFPLPAARPAHAPLDCAKARARFGIALPPWRESLARALADEERA
jgi:dTDP-4-dehydrorhamnose reductase